MKCLFVTSSTDDYLSSCLWDGLQEVLGEDNVYDAGFTPSLHYHETSLGPSHRISGSRPGKCLQASDGDFDLLVLNKAFLRDHHWNYAYELQGRLLSTARIAWVEGEDNYTDITVPPFAFHAAFRREIAYGVSYPYRCFPLLFSAPRRWFKPINHTRMYDVFYAASYQSNPIRWPTFSKMWDTQNRHLSIACSGSVGFETYFDFMRNSKITICPPGAGSDCMHQWEAIACGSIPLFVGHVPMDRGVWFPECILTCDTVEDLPRVIDHALGLDLEKMRAELNSWALLHHTTAARAKFLLEKVRL